MSAEPNSKLIDWMSIDGAMRRISGRRRSWSRVTRRSGAMRTDGAASSLRSICAALGVEACEKAGAEPARMETAAAAVTRIF
jgi:hypothetical protein